MGSFWNDPCGKTFFSTGNTLKKKSFTKWGIELLFYIGEINEPYIKAFYSTGKILIKKSLPLGSLISPK